MNFTDEILELMINIVSSKYNFYYNMNIVSVQKDNALFFSNANKIIKKNYDFIHDYISNDNVDVNDGNDSNDSNEEKFSGIIASIFPIFKYMTIESQEDFKEIFIKVMDKKEVNIVILEVLF